MRLHTTALLAVLFIGTVSAPASIRAEKPRPATELVGLWKAERDFGPEAQGQLTIRQDNGNWLAEISGYSVTFPILGDNVTFAVPGGRGGFTGTLSASGDSISGHWIQPLTAASWNQFASPVYLLRTATEIWQGTVIPLEDKMTFYLLLRQNASGTVGGFFRNPQTNFGRFLQFRHAVIMDDDIGFLEAGTNVPILTGTYHPETDVFSVLINDAGGTFDFRRVTDTDASNFYPRPKTDPPYTYHPPMRADDGWEVASLADVGMSVGPIEDLVRRVVNTPMDSITSPCTHAFLIARHGKLVAEEYFHGYTADWPHETRSASKSVTSTLIGIAIQNGVPISLSTPVYGLMYGGRAPANLDPRARRITLKHLLTMSSGLDCDDFDPQSRGQEEVMQVQTEQPDWVQYTLDLTMIYEPGEHTAYCSASPNLAAAMLRKATDTWLPEFYRTNFAEPMEMGLYHMNLMPTGDAYGGGGLYIKPRDFLKLGQLFLNGGVWKGKRLLSEQWVHDAVSPQVDLYGGGYGYLWWDDTYPYKDTTVRIFLAGGNGGQYIIGIPELDMVLGIFGGNYGQPVARKFRQEYVPEYILKSVELGSL